MAGEHRTLYLAFIAVSRVEASVSEKPKNLLAVVSWSMKWPRCVWLRFMNLCTYARAMGPPLSSTLGNCLARVQPNANPKAVLK